MSAFVRDGLGATKQPLTSSMDSEHVEVSGQVANTNEELESGEDVSQLYEGFAAVFQRVADSVEGIGPSGTKDHDILMAFATEAAKLVNHPRQ